MTLSASTPGVGELAAEWLCVAPNRDVVDALAGHAQPGQYTMPSRWPLTNAAAQELSNRGVHGVRVVAASPDPGGMRLATMVGSRSITVARTLANNPDLREADADALLTRHSGDTEVVAALARRWPSAQFLAKLAVSNPELHTALDSAEFGTYQIEVLREQMARADVAFGVTRAHTAPDFDAQARPALVGFAEAWNRHASDPDNNPDPVDAMDSYDDILTLGILHAMAPRAAGKTWDSRLRARAVALIDAIPAVRDVHDSRVDPGAHAQARFLHAFSEANICDADVADYTSSTSPVVWEALAKAVARGTVCATEELFDALSTFVLSGRGDGIFFREFSELCPAPQPYHQQPLAVNLSPEALSATIAGRRFSRHQAYRYLCTPGLPAHDIVNVLACGDLNLTCDWIVGDFPNRGGANVFAALRRNPGEAFREFGTDPAPALDADQALRAVFTRLAQTASIEGAGLWAKLQLDIVASSCSELAAQCSANDSRRRKLAKVVFARLFGQAFAGDSDLWLRAVMLAPTWADDVTSLTHAVVDMSADAADTP